MKFVIGKFSGGALHAIDRRQLALLFKTLPKEWLTDVNKVVLSAKIITNKKKESNVLYDANSQTLTLFSRGEDKDQIVTNILRTLALLNTKPELVEVDLSKSQLKNVDSQVAPYLKKFKRINRG
jgi:hypothetical protein